jgi:hypothetical protein
MQGIEWSTVHSSEMVHSLSIDRQTLYYCEVQLGAWEKGHNHSRRTVEMGDKAQINIIQDIEPVSSFFAVTRDDMRADAARKGFSQDELPVIFHNNKRVLVQDEEFNSWRCGTDGKLYPAKHFNGKRIEF